MTRAARLASWALPVLLSLALYGPGVEAWFAADDFGMLRMRSMLEHTGWWQTLFAPIAQGTIRPLSERIYFIALPALFGLRPLPFHLCALATLAAAATLLNAIVRRLGGRPWTGTLAASLWMIGAGLSMPAVWPAAYNQLLCAVGMLAALWCWVRFAETGRGRFLAGTWAAFAVGLGALEIAVVFPAIAAAYAWLHARRLWKHAAGLVAASVVYAVAHRVAAPVDGGADYAMRFDASLAATAWQYWLYLTGVQDLWRIWHQAPRELLHAASRLGPLAAAALLAWAARRRLRTAGLFVVWTLATLAPVLPLVNHVAEYYLAIPAAGFAAALAIATADAISVRQRWAVAACLVFALTHAFITPCRVEWFIERSLRVRTLVTGCLAASKLHPGKQILLDGIDSELFHGAILDGGPELYGVRVGLAPVGGSERLSDSDLALMARFRRPESIILEDIINGKAVVYRVEEGRWVNVTTWRLVQAIASRPPLQN